MGRGIDQHHSCSVFDGSAHAVIPANRSLPLECERRAPSLLAMSLSVNWKRPLTYLLIPVVIVLVFVGVLPPFPPLRPTKPAQEQSEPAEDKNDA
jgi:hypothetical protein